MSEEIKRYLAQLRQVLASVPPISTAILKSLHKAKDYKGMVQLIKKSMNIEGVTIKVLWVPEGAANEADRKHAPAWISLPPDMPYYGTEAFRASTLTMCIRKSFLKTSTFDQAAILIAHELSHVVLDSIQHPLRREEKAVDLTAMLLGFRLLYRTACYKRWYVGDEIRSQHLGYLTPEEVIFANNILERDEGGEVQGKKVRHSGRWSKPLRQSAQHAQRVLASPIARAALYFTAGIVLTIAVQTISNTWVLHEALTAEQRKEQQELAKRRADYISLADVRVGVREITRVYHVSAPKNDIPASTVSNWEKGVRRDTCAGERKVKVRDGATYSYEFRDVWRDLIVRFEISSCA